MATRLIFYDGLKSIALEQYPEEAWKYFSGGPQTETKTIIELRRVVPWLYRGVDMRTAAVASMPFDIYRGDKSVDGSHDYQNVVGFWPNPRQTLRLIERCLTVIGYAYLYKLRQGRQVAGLKYLVPTTIEYVADETRGLTGFKRNLPTLTKALALDDVVYFWPEDESLEVGPPASSPGKAALNAAGVLANVDEFMASFFKRGAIKATLLTVEDLGSAAEREKLETWWKNVVAGIKNAFGAKVVNAKRVTPVVIGEGLKELENQSLTREKREEIASALGIPQTKLFSASAGGLGGGGVAMQDDIRFYTETVVPECEFIAEVLNLQLFEPLGYSFRFKPETLDIFQEDENQRAASVGALVMALQAPEEFDIAASILGLEMDDETQQKFAVLLQRKAESRAQAAALPPALPAPTAAPVAPVAPGQTPGGEIGPGQAAPGEQLPEPTKAVFDPRAQACQDDLARWQRKALKRIGKECLFESETIPPLVATQIAVRLPDCSDAEAVKAIFAEASRLAELSPAEIKASPDFTPLVAALREATQALRETATKEFTSQAQRESFFGTHPEAQHGGAGPTEGGGARAGFTTERYGETRIHVKEGLDTNFQPFSSQDVQTAIGQIPAEYRGMIKDITLSDDYFTDDDGGILANVAGTYNRDTGEITMWSGATGMQPSDFQGYVRHEFGHAYEDELGADFEREWKAVTKSEAATVSDYAKTNDREDFAETLRLHWSPDRIERMTVERFFPQRAALLKKFGIKPGGGS